MTEYFLIEEPHEARRRVLVECLGDLRIPYACVDECLLKYVDNGLFRALLGITSPEMAAQIIDMMEGTLDPCHVSESADRWVRQCHHRPGNDELIMHAADAELLDTHGVEGVDLPDGRFMLYCNTGDTYKATLCKVDDEWCVASWGDVMEEAERAHAEEQEQETPMQCGRCESEFREEDLATGEKCPQCGSSQVGPVPS